MTRASIGANACRRVKNKSNMVTLWQWARRHLGDGGILTSVRARVDISPSLMLGLVTVVI